MASNKDLIIEAEALARELGQEVTTEGLNNKALAELVSNIKVKKKAAEIETRVIAKGKSLTSLKGILGEGEPVSPEHFVGGQATFDDLKERGFIE